MTSKTLCRLVRFAAISTSACGLIILAYILPLFIESRIVSNLIPFTWYYPWMAFIILTSLPCFAVMVLVWLVSYSVKNDEVFTVKTSKRIQYAAVLLFADAGFFLLGNVVLSILHMNNSLLMLGALFLDIFIIALALLASVLSRYIAKAAALQEESDGTI